MLTATTESSQTAKKGAANCVSDRYSQEYISGFVPKKASRYDDDKVNWKRHKVEPGYAIVCGNYYYTFFNLFYPSFMSILKKFKTIFSWDPQLIMLEMGINVEIYCLQNDLFS